MDLSIPANSAAVEGRVLLVSAPWPLFNRPSLPLGALKAHLAGALPHVQVAASHFFLQVAHGIGYDRYQTISERVWRAEAVYAALLDADCFNSAEALWAGTFKGRKKPPVDFQWIVRKVKTITDHWVDHVDWSALSLVGLSISFCQVTASVYLMSQIKARHPSLPIVVGGSSFSGGQPTDIFKVFPQIDYLVVGEGERPLVDLVRQLLPSRKDSAGVSPAGVASRDGQHGNTDCFCQVADLDRLPLPDYDDYFKMLAGFSPTERFFPTLPLEASRGCWWHRRDSSGQFKGCAFCNLNVQWRGYRSKSVNRMVQEVDRLVQRYQVLSLAFCDNALPIKTAGPVFDNIRRQDRDLSIFVEIRANVSPNLLHTMRQGGVDTVQIGIEALSTQLLKKMNKGSRAIDNLSAMKHCESLGIVNASNLILHFPGSDQHDVKHTLEALEFAQWYRPLKAVRFWLGLESPVYRHARQFGLQSTFNHPNLGKLFPASIARGFGFMIQDYRGDRLKQRKLWRPVERRLRQWRRDFDAMQRQTDGRPALSFKDGGRFIIIDQHRPVQPVIRHRLTGTSADIYRYCQVPRSIRAIAGAATSHGRDRIEHFLGTMVEKRLVYVENDHYLSLAVPAAWRP